MLDHDKKKYEELEEELEGEKGGQADWEDLSDEAKDKWEDVKDKAEDVVDNRT